MPFCSLLISSLLDICAGRVRDADDHRARSRRGQERVGWVLCDPGSMVQESQAALPNTLHGPGCFGPATFSMGPPPRSSSGRPSAMFRLSDCVTPSMMAYNARQSKGLAADRAALEVLMLLLLMMILSSLAMSSSCLMLGFQIIFLHLGICGSCWSRCRQRYTCTH